MGWANSCTCLLCSLWLENSRRFALQLVCRNATRCLEVTSMVGLKGHCCGCVISVGRLSDAGCKESRKTPLMTPRIISKSKRSLSALSWMSMMTLTTRHSLIPATRWMRKSSGTLKIHITMTRPCSAATPKASNKTLRRSRSSRTRSLSSAPSFTFPINAQWTSLTSQTFRIVPRMLMRWSTSSSWRAAQAEALLRLRPRRPVVHHPRQLS